MKSFIAFGTVFAAVLFLFHCSKPTDSSGNGGGSETGNAIVSGHLYKATGPAIGAKVYFVRVNYNPHSGALEKAYAISDTVITDSSGLYGTDDLDSGTYNVFGTGTDGNLSLLDSVTITGDSQVVDPDTLKTPASLAGYIKVFPGDEPDKIFAIIMGSNTFSFVTTSARFSFTNLAEGQYSVKFFSTLDNYSNKDTTFTIIAGENRDLGVDSIVMPLKIPIPTGFTIQYDTLKQIVTLAWNRMNPIKVKGYNVYRQHVDSSEVKLNIQPTTDTFYVDSTGIQDETYVYRISSVNLTDEEGAKTQRDTIVIATYFIVDSIYSGSSSGQFNNPTDIAVANNGDIYVVDRGNKRIQVFDKNMQPKLQFSTDPLLSPVRISLDSARNAYVKDGGSKIALFDSTGLIKDSLITGTNIFDIEVTNDTIFTIQKDSILSYDLNGNRARAWGGSGTAIGQYSAPEWIVSDGGSKIYISDVDNHRVQVCDPLGNVSASFDIPSYPTSSIAVDSVNGRLYVNYKPPEGNKLRVFNRQKNIIADYKYGSYNYWLEPIAIGISQDGSLLVVEATSNVIVKLRPLF